MMNLTVLFFFVSIVAPLMTGLVDKQYPTGAEISIQLSRGPLLWVLPREIAAIMSTFVTSLSYLARDSRKAPISPALSSFPHCGSHVSIQRGKSFLKELSLPREGAAEHCA